MSETINEELGELSRVELNEIWANEAQDFTPWLANENNLALLGRTLGMELELIAQEQNVGPFRADIYCTNTDDNSHVLIENQLERTDHTHLGQLMTYAAGLSAVSIVWIAGRFTDEHRAALDWLNNITENEFQFFGIEVELWRIGQSQIAPKFNIISKPNDWSRTMKQTSQQMALTDTKKLQFEFWQKLKRDFDDTNFVVNAPNALPQHWLNFGIGKSGTKLVASINTTKNSISVGFLTEDENGKAYFDLLHKQRKEIEKKLGFTPEWNRMDGKKMTAIRYYLKDIDFSNQNKWAEYIEWLKTHLKLFDKAFRTRVKALDISEWVDPDQDVEGER